MIDLYFDRIHREHQEAEALMIGYSQDELNQLERLYNINISGDFRIYMLRAGRSDGGVIGDDPLIIYRSSWSVRTHIARQMKFIQDLRNIEAHEFINQPFLFSIESESHYFFLQTGVPGDTDVYHYDEDSDVVVSSGFNIYGYLNNIVNICGYGSVNCIGEMLRP